jgi:hypothetical protein
MMHRLFPQLSNTKAQPLAAEFAAAAIEHLRSRSMNHHSDQIVSPTGGQQVSRSELDELAAAVRGLCDSGTPEAIERQRFDAALSRVVHPRMLITRHEAALEGIWCFLGCVLLPDIVRWRFPGPATPEDRFLGMGRGVRNVLGRAWWRGELLRDETAPPGRDPYWLLDELGEDELTGIIERPRAVASRRVAVALSRALVETDCRGIPRPHIARDAFKVYLRLGYFVEFEALTEDELRVACQSLYRRSVMTLLKVREEPSG